MSRLSNESELLHWRDVENSVNERTWTIIYKTTRTCVRTSAESRSSRLKQLPEELFDTGLACWSSGILALGARGPGLDSRTGPKCIFFKVIMDKIIRIHFYLQAYFIGGTVASWLARSTPERALRVRALAGDIVLCSWARHFTLTVPLSTQVYKWVPANLMLGGNPAMD